MSSEVDKDLLVILENPSLRLGAKILGWQYLLGLSVTEEGLHRIISFQKYLPFLTSYIETDSANKETLTYAHKCLINISATEEGASALLNAREDLVFYLLSRICDTDYRFIEETCFILSNLSKYFHIIKTAENILEPHLIEQLLKGFSSAEEETRKKYQFLAMFFANVSGHVEQRRFLLDNDSFLSSILCNNPEEEPVRRLGIALTLRNCCSETEYHTKLLGKEILPILLLPLMDGEEYEEEIMELLPVECQYLESDKKREPMSQIRRALIQALSLLCYTESGWNYLKEHSVYYVIRQLHLWEEDEITKEAIETLIGFLLVLNYSDMKTEQSVVTPSATEIMQDIPDFLILQK